MQFNQVTLVGNLTRDPETKTLQSGTAVCKFRIASNHTYTSNGEKKEEALFVDVEAWGNQADACGRLLSKGRQVLVSGRLKIEEYETQSGERRQAIVIVATTVQFGPQPGGESASSAPPAPWQSPSKPAPRTDPMPTTGGEDDLPF